jgi:hypothetical protein
VYLKVGRLAGFQEVSMRRQSAAHKLSATLSAVALIGFSISACNAITGADAIVLDDVDDDEDDGGSEGAGAGDTTAVAVGSGGQTSGPAGPTGSGGTVDGAGAGAGPTSTGSGTGAGDPTGCEYPAGPYGVAQGQVVPPSLSWQGFAPGSTTAETISIQDFFDCDGSRGIHAVLFDTSQYG